MGTYDVESSTVAHRGTLSTVRVDRVVMPDGQAAEREVVEHTDAVAVVPIDSNGRIVLIRHYRHAVGERLIEIPAGKLDVEDEAPVAAARRELLEEVGLEAAHLQALLRFYNSSGWSDEATTVYLARDVSAGAPAADFTPGGEEADLEVFSVPLAEAVAMVERGDIHDAKTVIGILLTARHLANDEPPLAP